MIDISEVRDLEREARNKKYEASKKIAEEQFPEALGDAEKNIKETISYFRTYCDFDVSFYVKHDEIASMFLQIMLIQALPLNGFLCKLSRDKNNTIRIWW